MIWLMIDKKNSYETDSLGHPIVFPNIHPPQPEVLSPSLTHWVIFLGIYAIEMINPLCKHCASSISIFIDSVQEFLCTYWESKCFQKQWIDFEGSKMISTYYDFFDKIISAWFAKFDFMAYSHVFQVILNWTIDSWRTKFSHQKIAYASFVQLNPLFFQLQYNSSLHPCLCFFAIHTSIWKT